MEIRDACKSDFDSIVNLNQLEEKQTSPLDLDRLQYLSMLSSYHKVALFNNQVAGFLLAMRENAPYENDNFEWFASRYKNFLYIDRIVVSSKYAGMKIGSSLYTDLISFSKATEVKYLVCEYNIDPPNHASKAFHFKMGFNQVGKQYNSGNKYVSMQARET